MIKVPVPSKVQNTDYSCGAASLQSICAYFGLGFDNEKQYIKALGTNKNVGTRPTKIIELAKKLGLTVSARKNMKIDDLKQAVASNKPVICPIQAYGDEEDYHDDWNGHYVVVIGYDRTHIFLHDPMMDKSRGKLSIKDFEKRWHDTSADGVKYNRYGIALWANKVPEEKGKKKKAKKVP